MKRVTLAVIWGLLLTGWAAADAEDRETVGNVFLLPERSMVQKLSQARTLIGQGRFSEAVLKLGEILDQPEDFFYQPQRDRPGYRSLKAEAQRMIGELPPAGRRQYEEEYGARAEQLLAGAAAAGDRAGLAEVARHYFHTRAGYQATFLLGLDELDRGRPLSGALVLKRLLDVPEVAAEFEPALSLSLATCWLRSGSSEKAQEVLVEFARRYSGREILIAGRRTALFREDSEAVDWLQRQVGRGEEALPPPERWAIYRGDPQRNAASPGGAPLMNLRWAVPMSDDPQWDEALGQYRQWQSEQGIPTLPSLHPLMVDGVVLLRTFRNLLAVDFATGKRLWETPSGEPADSAEAELFRGGSADPYFLSPQIQLAAEQLCENTIYGTLSSDGRLVFSVEEAAEDSASAAYPTIAGLGRATYPRSDDSFNWLAAHDLHTGKRRWQVGGPAEKRAKDRPKNLPATKGDSPIFAAQKLGQSPAEKLGQSPGLSGTYFLGPPLPLMGRLYVLGEAEGEVRLAVLDADSGRPLWTQQLAMVEAGIRQDPLRRLIAATPSYGEGVLVCPTAMGALVAIDPATRSLLWGYQYGREGRGPGGNPFIAAPFIINHSSATIQTAQWIDPAVSIAEGLVFVTPIESKYLHCLNLADGKLQWKAAREDDLYLACIHQGKAVLVGRRGVRALNAADGKPAWKGRRIGLPEGVLCSGRGFYNGDEYFLPVDAGEVLIIDLNEGRIRGRAKSRSGEAPGNLVCCQGRILSQNIERLCLFAERGAAESEVRRRLAAGPNDPEALRLHGELLWDGGQRREAIGSFRQALALGGDPHARGLLREALFEGLREDFAGFRQQTGELEQLLDEPEQRALFLRLMAEGLARTGHPWESFEQLLKLADLDKGQPPLEILDKKLSVRRDLWVQSRLSALRSEEPAAIVSRMDEALSARSAEAAKAAALGPLQRFFDYFGSQPAAEQARGEFLSRLQKAGRLLEAEWRTWQATEVPPSRNPGALAEVSAMYRRSGRLDAAAAGYRRLLQRFPDTACIEHRESKVEKTPPALDQTERSTPTDDGYITPRQFVETLAADDPLRRRIVPPDAWPTGKVEATTEELRSPNPGYGRIPLRFEGSPGPYFAERNLLLDPSQRTLICTDALGRELWNLTLADVRQARQFMFFQHGGPRAKAWGHLLVLFSGGQPLVLDTLGDPKNPSPKILWPQSDGAVNTATGIAGGVRIGLRGPAAGPVILPMRPGTGDAAALTGRYICFQRVRSVTAVDPLTGQTLWQRQGIPPAGVIFGDDQYVFVLPRNASEALVLRAGDGELLGKRKVGLRETASREDNPFADDILPEGQPWSEWCLALFGRQILRWKNETDQKRIELFDPWAQKAVWTSQPFPANAKNVLVEGEELGVMDPEGKFTLLGLPDGRVLFQTALRREPLLESVNVWRNGEGYLVLANGRSVRPADQPSQPVRGSDAQHIGRGRLYALDRSGKPLWPHPVTVRDQYVFSNPPAGLPAIVFACQRYIQPDNGPGKLQLSMLLVDKRTGRACYQETKDVTSGVFLISGDAKKKTIQLGLQQQIITLAFTDRPWPAVEEVKKQADKAAKPRAIDSLFKALRQMGKRFTDPDKEEED